MNKQGNVEYRTVKDKRRSSGKLRALARSSTRQPAHPSRFGIRCSLFFSGPVLLVSVLFFACQAPPEPVRPAFFHWQTRLALTPAETAYLDALHCRKLYVKFLDIGVDPANGAIEPYALLEVADTNGLSGKTIVPCVFIANRVFQNISPEKLNWLAQKTAGAIASAGGQFPRTAFPEIQFDCDWTEGTRHAYFSFLTKIKPLLPAGARRSATIRLHQYKFPGQTGVPPVERGMLMLYNTGDIDDWTTENSIFDPADANKYLDGVQPGYPLPLDLALPAFNWALVYRDGELWKIIPDPAPIEFEDTTRFKLQPSNFPELSALSRWLGGQAKLQTNSPRFRIQHPTFLAGHYLRTGDLIRVEAIDTARLWEAAGCAAEIKLARDASVAFYHLDTSTVHQYPADWLKTVCETINTARK